MLLGSCVVVNVVVYERLPLRHKKLNKQTIKQTISNKEMHTHKKMIKMRKTKHEYRSFYDFGLQKLSYLLLTFLSSPPDFPISLQIFRKSS